MARFQFIPRSFLTSRRTACAIVHRALREQPPQAAFEPAQGPGWFDSSFELSHGLDVRDAGEGGYDDWLAARAIAERRVAAKRAPRRAAPAPRAEPGDMMDLADLADLTHLARRVSATPADATPTVDEFSRFGIEGLALA
ncbi:hypothetical protein [Rhizobacter fulvus]|jgi:hypothetical protein